MSAVGWWNCSAGASGDMCLGALVDAGVPLAVLSEAVDAVAVQRVRLAASVVERHGLAATRVEVHAPTSGVIRTWANIRDLLERAQLGEPVRATALGAFSRIAEAEAVVHRTSPELVHFHEVGALDAIADIVGTAAGLAVLGLDQVVAAPVAVGSGMTRSGHGLLPVPAPAVLEILRAAAAPVSGGPAPHEMCTPTGAALLAQSVTSWGPMPAMRVTTVGTGAGGRDVEEVPNVLQLVVGTAADDVAAAPSPAVAPGAALVIETNVDDLDPRLWPAVLTRLLAVGASDAWLTPILMKKGRPALTLSVLSDPTAAEAVRRVVFTETSSIGLREYRVDKHALARSSLTVHVEGLPVRVKIASLDGEVVNATPEYEDVAAAAATLGRPAKVVLAAASAAACKRLTTPH